MSAWFILFLMTRRPPRSTRTDTLFPYTTLFRSYDVVDAHRGEPSPETGLPGTWARMNNAAVRAAGIDPAPLHDAMSGRSEEHTSELQSLMRTSYAGLGLKKNMNHMTRLERQHD